MTIIIAIVAIGSLYKIVKWMNTKKKDKKTQTDNDLYLYRVIADTSPLPSPMSLEDDTFFMDDMSLSEEDGSLNENYFIDSMNVDT